MKNIKLAFFNFKHFVIIMLCVSVLYACDDDDNGENPSISNQDKEFIMDIGHANQAEIELGTLAASKATNESVQDFAEQMVTDHTSAQNKLMTIADDKGVTVPDESDDAHKALKEQLSALEGYKFDSAYMSAQVDDHEMAQDILEMEIDEGEDNELQDYASETLETINMHLEMATELRDELNNNQPD